MHIDVFASYQLIRGMDDDIDDGIIDGVDDGTFTTIIGGCC